MQAARGHSACPGGVLLRLGHIADLVVDDLGILLVSTVADTDGGDRADDHVRGPGLARGVLANRLTQAAEADVLSPGQDY